MFRLSNQLNLIIWVIKKVIKEWYTGETSIKPIDDTIKKAFDNGYLNHIERLMVMLIVWFYLK